MKQLAWLNSIEFAQLPLEERVAQWSAFRAEHDGQFEQPSTDRLPHPSDPHDVLGLEPRHGLAPGQYTLVDGEWRIGYLAG